MKKIMRVGAVLLLLGILPLSIIGYVTRRHLGNYVLRVREKLNRHSSDYPVYYPGSSYNRNPNASDLVIPKDEDLSFLNDVLRKVFPNGADGLSDEEKSIEILKFASSALRLKANKGSATKMLKEGFTLCGGMAGAFVMLSRAVGLPARPASAKYMPSFSEHVVSEVFYADNWHLFDPTFGIFFYSRAEYDKQGYVISFHEFLCNPDIGTPFKVVSRPWAGSYGEETKLWRRKGGR
jgi:transglutaminase-like putative cysteine protease